MRIKCEVCEKEFSSIRIMKQHFLRIHNRKVTSIECDICGKLLQTSLKIHKENVHNPKVEAACELCGITFKYATNLTSHLKSVHEKVKKFQFKACEKSFSRRHHLERHFGSVHQKKKFSCIY